MDEQTPPRRSSRQRTPAAPYTPSNEDHATQRNYAMCKKKALKKTQKACNRESVLYEVNKHGNIILVFQPAAYQFYYEALHRQIQEMKENNAYNIHIIPSVDSNGEEVDKIVKIQINRKKTCTINCYHTTYKMMINGRTLTYTGTIHPTVCTNMQTQNISNENQRILDRISSEITNRGTEPRDSGEISTDGAVGAIVSLSENNSNTRQNSNTATSNGDRQIGRISVPNEANNEDTMQTSEQEDETSLKSLDNRAAATAIATHDGSMYETTRRIRKIQTERSQIEDTAPPAENSNVQQLYEETSLKELTNQTEEQGNDQSKHKNENRLIIPISSPTSMHINNDLIASSNRTEEVDEQEPPLLCPVCNRPAETGTIECSKCNTWIHYECENMEHRIDDISLNAEFMCSPCVLDEHQHQQNSALQILRQEQEQQSQQTTEKRAVQLNQDASKPTKKTPK